MRTTAYQIIHEVLRREGGFVNDPADRGGATNYGITLETLRRHGIDVDKDGDIDVNDVKVLPVSEAIEIYGEEYWIPSRADEIPERLRDIYFDMCVNHGIKSAITILQIAVCVKGADIAVDGIIGPQTLSHVKLLTVKDVAYERLYYYSKIIEDDPSQIRFREGWYNRTLEFIGI